MLGLYGGQDGGIPLWVAGGGEKKTLRIAAQYADYTNFDGTFEGFAHKSEVLRKHCADVGTDFDAITRSANYNITIGEAARDVQTRLDETRNRLLEHVPEVAVDIAAVTYRMIFALLDAASAIRAAQAGRLGYASGRAARRSVGQLCAAVLVAAWDKARRLEDGLAGRGGVAAVPLVPARAVSTPFVLAAGALVVGLAGLSLRAGLS